MLWIKRNLFLAVGGLAALLLLGGGVWYLWTGLQRNTELDAKELEAKGTLDSLYGSNDPFPSSNNIEIAKKEAEKLRETAVKSKKFFVPVPYDKVTGLAFRTLLLNTIDEMRKMAAAAPTELPSKTYAFSFTVQNGRTDFSPSTFPMIPEQLAEVKAICALLFEARISRLLNIRRVKVSDEDIRTGGTDYHNLPVEIDSTAQVSAMPYELSFHCYSTDLAHVMTSFNKSPYGFVLKAMQVEPEDGVKLVEAGTPPSPEAAPAPAGRPNVPLRRTQVVPPRQPPGTVGRPAAPVPVAPLPVAPAALPSATRKPGADRPIILLNEKRLKVTALLYVVKPLK